MGHEQDDYSIGHMNVACIKMLDGITDKASLRENVLKTISQLEAMKASGEEWAKAPNIPFRMGCMDERDLDERIADNIVALQKIDHRIACLKVLLDDQKISLIPPTDQITLVQQQHDIGQAIGEMLKNAGDGVGDLFAQMLENQSNAGGGDGLAEGAGEALGAIISGIFEGLGNG